jgi:hypothetical protein
VFYEDARRAIEEWMFKEVVYADDLNAYREFIGTTENDHIVGTISQCQTGLHAWGRASQVAFDPSKESKHVISAEDPEGPNFKLLGINFDCAIEMTDAIGDVVNEAGWKLKTLLRRRFYCDVELVLMYKSHLLSYLEYRTPAIYHAKRDALSRLDNVQQRFLRDAGIDDLSALMNFNLAPLATRRDIAMLGLIQRTVLNKGPPHFREHFKEGSQPLSPSCRPAPGEKRPRHLQKRAGSCGHLQSSAQLYCSDQTGGGIPSSLTANGQVQSGRRLLGLGEYVLPADSSGGPPAPPGSAAGAAV